MECYHYENDNEEVIRQSIIKESLSNNFLAIGSNDFEFVKVMQRKLLPWNKVHELSKVLQL